MLTICMFLASSNNKTLNARLLAQVCHRSYIIAASFLHVSTLYPMQIVVNMRLYEY